MLLHTGKCEHMRLCVSIIWYRFTARMWAQGAIGLVVWSVLKQFRTLQKDNGFFAGCIHLLAALILLKIWQGSQLRGFWSLNVSSNASQDTKDKSSSETPKIRFRLRLSGRKLGVSSTWQLGSIWIPSRWFCHTSLSMWILSCFCRVPCVAVFSPCVSVASSLQDLEVRWNKNISRCWLQFASNHLQHRRLPLQQKDVTKLEQTQRDA